MAQSIQEKLSACKDLPEDSVVSLTLGELRSLAARARAVGALDAYAEANLLQPVPVATPYHSEDGRGFILWRIEIGAYSARSFPSADAVRRAAVEHLEATARAADRSAMNNGSWNEGG